MPVRRGYLIAWLAGTAVAFTTVGMGFFTDDYLLYLTLRGEYDFVAPLDAFQFISNDSETAQAMIDAGPFPWFTDPDMKVRFFRPLTALTMLIDVRAFQRFLPLYHLHSICWYALFLAAVGLCYRRIFPGTFGVFVFLLFALNETNFISAAWWASRNAPISGGLAFLGLAAHLHWRENGWKLGMPISLLAYALGLLGGETALSVLAYVAAYELAGTTEPLSKRLRCLFPAAALSAGYLLFYKAIGGGVSGSGIYLDPIANPLAYCKALPLRLIHFMTTHVFTIPAESVNRLPAFFWPVTLLGVMAFIALYVFWRKTAPSLPPDRRRSIQWLALGTLLATLPVLSMASAMRLLLIPSFGGVALLMLVVEQGWNKRTPQGHMALAAWAARGVFVLHVLLAPMLWPVQAYAFNTYAQKIEQASLNAEIDDSQIANQHVIILGMEDPLMSFFPMLVRWHHDLPRPQSWRFLSSSPAPHRFTRTAPNTIELELLDHALGETHFERLFREPGNPLRKGEVFQFREMKIEIAEATEKGATRVRFIFQYPLESRKYLFLCVDNHQLRQWPLPAVGETVELPLQQE